MKIPTTPPSITEMLKDERVANIFSGILDLGLKAKALDFPYYHWEKLRFLPPPDGFKIEDLWLAIKVQRLGTLKQIPLRDTKARPFQFSVPDKVLAELHRIDLGTGGVIGLPEPITNPQTRDRYIVRSLVEEAITSSQLEGAQPLARSRRR
jgi:hypothetical protein